jgi:hypothetical protein
MVEEIIITNSVADPGSGAFLTPWIRDPRSWMGKKSGSGSGMNNPDHISESVETIFGVQILEFFYAVPDPGSGIFLTLDPGSGMEKIRIRDPR